MLSTPEESFNAILSGTPLSVGVKLTQISIPTTKGRHYIPAIVTGKLAVNSHPSEDGECWVITHLRSGCQITSFTDRVFFDSVFGALLAATALESLDWSWVDEALDSDALLKTPDGFHDRVLDLLRLAQKWEATAIDQSYTPIDL